MYAIWRACEQFNIRPPNVKDNWDDCNVITQSELLAYSQIREYEDEEKRVELYKFLAGRVV